MKTIQSTSDKNLKVRPLWRSRPILEDKIEPDLQEVNCQNVQDSINENSLEEGNDFVFET